MFFTGFARIGFARSNRQSRSKEPEEREGVVTAPGYDQGVSRVTQAGAALAGGVWAVNAPVARGLEVADQSNTYVVRIE